MLSFDIDFFLTPTVYVWVLENGFKLENLLSPKRMLAQLAKPFQSERGDEEINVCLLTSYCYCCC